PEFPITLLEAVGRRLRRNYIWLFLILGIAWAAKLMLQAGPPYSIQSFLEQAAVGFIPGNITAFFVAGFFFVIFLVAVLTAGMRQAAGEVLPRHEVLDLSADLLQNLASAASHILPGDLSLIRRHQHLTIIITEQAEEVSQQLLSFLKRGVTALQGTGMYTGQPRSVLLCAVAPSEISRLKELVYALDENAFVVVNPTEEIWGSSFSDLQPRWRGKKPAGKEEKT
ncbi:MAG: DUF2270 domain-containing protein, partial [Deltaproteobacteria bacterium]|nr:DUF2270 domain-containing protein [Deltaproteobacteria bacterium]